MFWKLWMRRTCNHEVRKLLCIVSTLVPFSPVTVARFSPLLVLKEEKTRQGAGLNGLSWWTCLQAWDQLIWTKLGLSISLSPPTLPLPPPSPPPPPPPPPPLFAHEMKQMKWAHQSGVDSSGWVGAVGEVVGVVLAGGGRCSVGRAVHPQRRVQLRPAARQEPVLVGRAAEGGGSGSSSGGLGAACPVRDRPGNRIAASRTGVCRHEKLHEENRG